MQGPRGLARQMKQRSGLHQNWVRDYDPTTGRYIEADPLVAEVVEVVLELLERIAKCWVIITV